MDKIFVFDLALDCTKESLESAFSKYGGIRSAIALKGQGSGFITFTTPAAASKAVAESGSVAVDGKKAKVKSCCPSAVPAPKELAVKAVEDGAAPPLDVLIVRGHATATGITLAWMYAKSKTTTLVIWDRHHYKDKEEKVHESCRKPVYDNVGDEEASDLSIMGKAAEYIGAVKPKCALVHLGSDKVTQSNKKYERPLHSIDEFVQDGAINHVETYQAYFAAAIYAPWIHSFRAAFFIVMPHMTGDKASDDLCCTLVQTSRIVTSDPTRIPDGSGWTLGLRLADSDPSKGATFVFATMNSCAVDEGKKHALSAKIITMGQSPPQVKASITDKVATFTPAAIGMN